MPALTPYFAKTSFERLKAHLPGPIREATDKLLALLDDKGRAIVAEIQQALFPLATPASASKMLSTLLNDFNHTAEAQGHPVRMTITTAKNVGAAKRWVWFEGPAQAPHPPTPDLNAIPAERLTEQRGLPLNPPTLVLLTFNAHEHHAVLTTFRGGQTPATETRDGITYNHLGIHGGMALVHAISEAGSGGLGAAQQRASQAIRAWQPKAVIAVGIAFGMDEQKQKIGDVLVSTQLRPYELSKVNANGSLTPRASSPDASPCLLNRIRTVDSNHKAQHSLNWPKIEYGPILCGEKLVDNLDFRESLKSLYGPEAIGGEMEGTGLYVAAMTPKSIGSSSKPFATGPTATRPKTRKSAKPSPPPTPRWCSKPRWTQAIFTAATARAEPAKPATQPRRPAASNTRPPPAAWACAICTTYPGTCWKSAPAPPKSACAKIYPSNRSPTRKASMCWNICWLGRAIPTPRRCSPCLANTAWAKPSPASGWRWNWRRNGWKTQAGR